MRKANFILKFFCMMIFLVAVSMNIGGNSLYAQGNNGENWNNEEPQS